METLKRKWARTTLVLLYGSGILLLIRNLILDVVFPEGGPLYAGALWVAAAMMAAGVLLTLVSLRCPNCGRGFAPLQWRAGEDGYCRYCGKPFPFDDGGGEDRP